MKAIFYPRAQAALDRGASPFDLYGYLDQTISSLEPSEENKIVQYLDESYRHGGGWNDFEGFTLHGWDSEQPQLSYHRALSATDAICYWQIGNTRVILFDHAWVAVAQSDNSFRVARMD